MKISAIIPTYNNASTIRRVVDVVSSHPRVFETIVVADRSADGTEKLLRGMPGIRLIVRKKNQGKGAAVVDGWLAARGDVILGLDADLPDIHTNHIDVFLEYFLSGRWDMVVGASGGWRLFSWVNGNRIYRKQTVLPYALLAKETGYGIEQVINHAHRHLRTQIVQLPRIRPQYKYHRSPIPTAVRLYAWEGWELARTEYRLGFPVTRQSLTTVRSIALGINFLREVTKYF